MTGSGSGIRRAEASDAERIHALETQSFPSPWTLESFLDLILRPDVEVQVADDGAGGVDGYVVWWTVAGEGEVANIAVDPSRRGVGIGGRLLDAALDGMREVGGSAAFLEVRASNHAARALYEGRGFRVLAVRTAYYRKPVEDALIMSLSLERETE